MPNRRWPSNVVLLDKCIDRLLAGQPCDDLVARREPDDTELPALVEVASQLVIMAGHVPERPRAPRTRFHRELRRLQQVLHLRAAKTLPIPSRPSWLRPVN